MRRIMKYLFQEKQNNNNEIKENIEEEKIENFNHSDANSDRILVNKRRIYRGLTFASVIVDPLFSYFLFVAVRKAYQAASEELGNDNPSLEWFFLILFIIISIMNALCDFLVVNPIEEAEEALLESEEKKEEKNKKGCKKGVVCVLRPTNQVVANFTYIIGSASDAISIAYLTSNTVIRFTLGIPITVLGLIYYNMMTKSKVDEHTDEYASRLLDCKESMVINSLKSPAISLEVSNQVLINAINRAVRFGYIMNQLLTTIFNIESGNPLGVSLVILAVVTTFYSALFSRTLNVHKQFFNKEFLTLSDGILKQTKVSKSKILIDGMMTLLRAVPAATLIYRHSFTNPVLKSITAITSGLAITFHSSYARYNRSLYKTALENRKMSPALGNIQSSDALTLPFDSIQNQYKTNSLKTFVTILNTGARMTSWFSFYGFLVTLQQLITPYTGLNLDFYDLLCIHQLWCIPSLENDASFYQDSLVDNLTYYQAKVTIERKFPTFGWGAFWRAKTEYSELPQLLRAYEL